MTRIQTILFVCTHNSCRSQIAEGLTNHLTYNKYHAFSAGTEKTEVKPLAVSVLKELGIDISSQYSKLISEAQARAAEFTKSDPEKFLFDIVITVCDNAKEACPYLPGKINIHRAFQDPSAVSGTEKEILKAYRDVRDEIKDWIIEEFK